MSVPQTAAVDVFLVLRDQMGNVLFGLRAAHLYAGGEHNLVSGKVDDGEDAIAALIREAREEAGIVLAPADVRPVGAVHTAGSDRPRVGFVFLADYDEARHGPVVNAERDKCDALVWADPDRPPQPLESYNAAALTLLTSDAGPLVLHGWPQRQTHRMHLHQPWFRLMASGDKTVELRLADPRRSMLRLRDLITFTDTTTGEEITVEVISLLRYPSFEHALDNTPPAAVAGGHVSRDTVLATLRGIYTADEERRHGALAIVIRRHTANR